jgi:O-antigen/teichoic acid export membrane protein
VYNALLKPAFVCPLKLNRNLLFTSFIGLLALPLVHFFGFFGFAYRKILQEGINLSLLRARAPFKIAPKFNKKILIELFKVSLPLQIPVYLDTKLLKASISLVILKTQGETELGIYAMALMFSGFLMIFSRSLNQIMTTKIMLKYGSNDSVSKTFLYAIKPVLLLSAVGCFILLCFLIALPLAVNNLIPKYSEAVIVAQILAIEMILAIIRTPFTLFASKLMYKSLFIQRMSKVLLTFILLYFFHSSLVEIVVVLITANFLNVVYGYLLLIIVIKREKKDDLYENFSG